MTTTTAFDVAEEIGRRCHVYGVMHEHKLLYYAQSWHLAWFGEPMFDEDIEAWQMGPVVADVWRTEKYDTPRPPARPLSHTHVVAIERVCNRYGRMTGAQLSVLTHDEKPWKHTWEHRSEFPNLDTITHDLMQSFYSEQAADQGWFWDSDWVAGEKEADDDIRSGNVETFDSTDEFLNSL